MIRYSPLTSRRVAYCTHPLSRAISELHLRPHPREMAEKFSTSDVVELLDDSTMSGIDSELDDEPCLEGSDDDLELRLSDDEER